MTSAKKQLITPIILSNFVVETTFVVVEWSSFYLRRRTFLFYRFDGFPELLIFVLSKSWFLHWTSRTRNASSVGPSKHHWSARWTHLQRRKSVPWVIIFAWVVPGKYPPCQWRDVNDQSATGWRDARSRVATGNYVAFGAIQALEFFREFLLKVVDFGCPGCLCPLIPTLPSDQSTRGREDLLCLLRWGISNRTFLKTKYLNKKTMIVITGHRRDVPHPQSPKICLTMDEDLQGAIDPGCRLLMRDQAAPSS